MGKGARYLFLSGLCFAVVNVFVRSVNHLPASQIIFSRAFISLLLTVTYLKFFRIPMWGSNKSMLLLRGLFGTVALSCFFYTLTVMPLASAVTIQYLSPVLTILVSGLFFKEIIQLKHWLLAGCGFLGVVIIQGFDSRVGALNGLIGLLGTVGSAFAYNSVRSLRHTESEWVVIFYFGWISSLFTAPFALRDWQPLIGWDLIVIIVIGVLTQLAQVFLTKGYQAQAASQIASINYLGIVYAMIFGVVLFGEPLHWSNFLGVALIFFSAFGLRVFART